MSRRIEIELTSARPDGTWTWRAAGAREPKGVLDGGLLFEGAKAGHVVRAEADFEIDGITIISVTPPKTDNRPTAQRIEIVGSGRPESPGVTTQLVGRRDRRGGDDDRRRDRGPGRPQDGRSRTEGAGRSSERSGREGGGGQGGRPQGRDGAPSREGAPGRDGERRRERTGRPAAGSGESADAAANRRRDGRPGGRDSNRDRDRERTRPEGGDRRPAGRTSSTAERSRAPRLNPGQAHRKAVMDSLAPEEQPIAEQLLRGGIPAVRTALHLEREKAEAEGRPAPNSEALLAIAESLLPRLRAAEWKDRAEAAVAVIDSISMRDLRSVVAGADQARDEESRTLATTLREAVERRVAKMHEDWTADITAQLEAGRVVRAVRLTSRAPDSSARLDAELVTRLTDAASAAMSPETAPDLWAALLEAVAESPIRRGVVPVGLPAEAPPDLKRAAHQFSGSIPALAKLLGVTIPPPPAPTGARRRPEGDGPSRRRPPSAPRPPKAADTEAAPSQPAETEAVADAPIETPPVESPPVQPVESPTDAPADSEAVAEPEALQETVPEAPAEPEGD